MSKINDIKDLSRKGYGISIILSLTSLGRKTIRKYLEQGDLSPEPPVAKTRTSIVTPYIDIITEWLEEDQNHRSKQCHTAKRIQERLRDEYVNIPGTAEPSVRRQKVTIPGAQSHRFSKGFNLKLLILYPYVTKNKYTLRRGRYMTKYREILRLLSLEISERKIAESCGVSRNTVSRIRKMADEIRLKWLFDALRTDKVLETRLYPKGAVDTNSKRMPDYVYIRKELLINGVPPYISPESQGNCSRSIGQVIPLISSIRTTVRSLMYESLSVF